MEEKKKRQLLKVDTRPAAAVLILSDNHFLGLSLAERLLAKNLRVFYFPGKGISGKNVKNLNRHPLFHLVSAKLPEGFDYLFQVAQKPLREQKYDPLKMLRLCHEVSAKYLFATSEKELYPRGYFTPLTKFHLANWRLVYFNFVYGPGLADDSVLSWLFSRVGENKLLLTAEAQDKFYPLFIDDLIEGMIRAMFSGDSKAKVYHLIGSEKIIFLDLVLKIKNSLVKPLKAVNYKAAELYRPWQVDSLLLEKIKKSWWRLGYRQKVGLEEGIKRTLKSNLKQKSKLGALMGYLSKLAFPGWLSKVFRLLPTFPQFKFKALVVNPKKYALTAGLVLFLVMILSLPMASVTVLGWLAAGNLNRAFSAGQKGDLAMTEKQTLLAKNRLTLAKKIFWQSEPFYGRLLPQMMAGTEELLSFSLDLSESLLTAETIFTNVKNLNEIIFQNKISDARIELNNLLVNLEELDSRLAFSQIKLRKIKKEIDLKSLPLPENLKLRLEWAEKELPAVRQKIFFARKLLSLTAELIALDGKKSYLLLLQNNSELRPTGGFIGSYALITFEKGRLLDFTVEDVYSADGQLKGHVEPPQPIKIYLDKANWFLRDANWSPDFPTAAMQTAWFLEKATGRRVDGVIGINLNLVKSLLSAFGPVELPEYNEKITADNLFEKAEYHAEINFFPGSTQKKSFLSNLAAFLFENIKTVEPQVGLNLSDYLEQNLAAKDLMFYFNDPVLQRRIQLLGWAGEIRTVNFHPGSQFTGPGLLDYLMLVDANLGINKANYFIQRQIDYEATILKEGQLSGQLKVVYQNQSPSETWPGGTYKNYLRLLLSADVEEIAVKQKDNRGSTYKTVGREKIDKTIEAGKNSFGFLVEVPPQEERELLITYQRGEKMPFSAKTLDWGLFFQKQPGTKADKLTVRLNYPIFLKPIKVMPSAGWESQKISFQGQLTEDRFFAVEFSH